MAQKWARWLATQPLPPGGSPPLQSGGQNHRWPTSGQGRYITLTFGGVPTALERRTESKVAHNQARWLHNPCRLGGPHRFKAAERIKGGPQSGKVAAQPLPPGGSPALQSREQNKRWSTSGEGGYITPAACGVPHCQSGGRNHRRARWLHNSCRLGGPHRFRAAGRIKGGPQVGKVAT